MDEIINEQTSEKAKKNQTLASRECKAPDVKMKQHKIRNDNSSSIPKVAQNK
jgi:hypothetical protein